MEAVAGFMPKYSRKDWLKKHLWEEFYFDLKEAKAKALDKVITPLEDMIKDVSGFKEFDYDKSLQESLRGDKNVKRGEIVSHILTYLYQKNFEAGIEDLDLGNIFMWNNTNNILRYLRRIRNDEPALRLPHPDKELALGLIERLRAPPIRSDGFWKSY